MRKLLFLVCIIATSCIAWAQNFELQPLDGGGQKKNICGTEPLAVCHVPATCTPDGWVAGPQLPAGSSCDTSSFQPGKCDGAGKCQTAPTVSGVITPAYYLVTILYAPPGAKSKASYFAGSSAGATTSTADMLGAGIKVGVTGNVIADTSYQYTYQSSDSFQVTKTNKNELDTTSVSDSVTHGQDIFYLWVNPQINYSQQQSPGMPVNISLGTVGNADFLVVPLTLDELTHKETIPAYKLQQLKNFTDADFAQIASADPWLAPGYQPDPSRYVKITELQLDGPDNAGDNISGQGTSVDDTQVACKTDTTSQSVTADLGFSAGITFFGQGEKVTVVSSVTWKDMTSAGSCNGASQTANVDLATGTVGYHDVIDVFEDSTYHSFAFVSETQGVGFQVSTAGVSGTITNAAGRLVAHQLVTVKFADGSTRKLFSNAQGKFRLFKVPPGRLTITSANSVTTAIYASGRPVVTQLKISGGALSTKSVSKKSKT